MTNRLSKLIRSISTTAGTAERKRTGAPVSYSFCEPPKTDTQSPSSSSSSSSSDTASVSTNHSANRADSVSSSERSGGEMHNILHKAAQHVPGKDALYKTEKNVKDKLKHSAGKPLAKHDVVKSGSLFIEMESPPLVMYGSTSGSTGALMSGQFKLDVTAPEIRLDVLELDFAIEQSTRRPVEKLCASCSTKITVLKTWRVITEPTTYKRGVHQFPFSYLLGGHLPASTETSLGSISYVLRGKAHELPRTGSASSNSVSDSRPDTPMAPDMNLRQTVSVYRAIQPPETDRTAIRVFPPTNLQATCTLPPLIHPMSNGFPVLLRLSGVSEHADLGKTVRTWRLKKLTWRLEEHTVAVSQACDKHAAKVGGKGKGMKHEDVSVLGGKELREGWKADYTPPTIKDAGKTSSSGTVEIELICGPKARRQEDVRPACDVETPSGFSVRHKLVIECVVTEELHPTDKPKWVAPTGVARILRMGFEIRVTERMGLGIAWDEEQPPVYEDVPASPPGYRHLDGDRIPDGLEELGPGARPIPGRENSARSEDAPFEPPPSYAENRLGIADDEEWDVERVDLSEGVRPDHNSDPRSRSRGFSPWTYANTTAGSSGWRSPEARPRLDASDLDVDPLSDMMRGRQTSEDRRDSAQVGARDE